LATAIIVVRPVLSDAVFVGLWGALLLAIAAQLSLNETLKWRFVSRYLALLLGIWSGILLLGAATGADDPLNPLSNFSASSHTAANTQSMQRFADVQQLQAQLKQAEQDGKWVLLDFYADWCISCKVMEKTVFGKA